MFFDLLHKINRKWMKMRLQPIRVFCFHQVSDLFDETTMWKCDWTSTEQFKSNILYLKRQYTFISLSEAQKKLEQDTFRYDKFAVLTADDGWASLKNIVPWLVENNIPVTLFVNPEYLDGKHFQERKTEKLLTKNEIEIWSKEYAKFISICSHGWNHVKITDLSVEQFEQYFLRSECDLANIPTKIPYYAFTYGIYTRESIRILRKHKIYPVLVDGLKNYKFDGYIHRECLDGLVYSIV